MGLASGSRLRPLSTFSDCRTTWGSLVSVTTALPSPASVGARITPRINASPSENEPNMAIATMFLAETVQATEPVPRFANAAMDGYAVTAADVAAAPVRLRVTGTVAAATGRRRPFRAAGQCG